MKELYEWMSRWGIPHTAVSELREMFNLDIKTESPIPESISEAKILQEVRLLASQRGGRLWRNNVGATYTKDNRFLRYGLANDSAHVNQNLKSSDLIGINPVTVTLDMVGKTVGIFMSREVKTSNWKYRDTEREKAQLAWITLITSLGGDAKFTRGVVDE